jgi:hypothetical protein
VLGSAEESGDLRTAIQALREISRLLELLGRFTGAPGGDGVSINLGGGPMSNVVVVLPSNGRESTDDSTPKITFEEIQEVRRLRHDRRV